MRSNLLALQMGKKKAEVIREVLEKGMEALAKVEKKARMERKAKSYRALDAITGSAKPGPVDAAETIDDYLYGEKSQYAK